MPYDDSTGLCTVCAHQVPLRRKSTPWGLHILLSVLTVGLWLPVLLFTALSRGPAWRCVHCGSTKVQEGEGQEWAFLAYLDRWYRAAPVRMLLACGGAIAALGVILQVVFH